MRVIAGQYKRRVLSSLQGSDITRPTSDRTKESIFNIISDKLNGSHVLDLFAGSGALGIEALSRGASKAIFIENHFEAVQIIQKNLENIKIDKENYLIFKKDVTKFLHQPPIDAKIDIIFADPPYSSSWYATAIEEIENSQICNKNCTVIFEMPKNTKILLQSNIGGWIKDDERHYGKTKIEIWRKGIIE